MTSAAIEASARVAMRISAGVNSRFDMTLQLEEALVSCCSLLLKISIILIAQSRV